MAACEPRFAVDVSLEPGPVIEAYKKDIDCTRIREHLTLTPEQRRRKLMEFTSGSRAAEPRT